MKKKNFLACGIFLIGLFGFSSGVSANNIPLRDDYPKLMEKVREKGLEALKSNIHANQLTAVMRNVLLDYLSSQVQILKNTSRHKSPENNSLSLENRIQALERRVTELENRPVFSADIGWRIWYSGGNRSTPDCPSGWLFISRGVYDHSWTIGDRYGKLCKIAHTPKMVMPGSKCTTNLVGTSNDGYDFRLKYDVGTIDSFGNCIKTMTKTFGGRDGERNLNQLP